MKNRACVLALSITAMTLSGCNKKVPECNSLVGIINPAVESINKASSGKSDKGADMAKSLNDVATTLNGTTTSLGKLDLSTPELKKFSGEYQRACKDAAVGASALATLLASVDTKVHDAETLQKTLETSMQQLVDACGADNAPSGCAVVSAKMKEMPTDLSKAPEVEKFATVLGQIKSSDPKVKDALAAVVKSFRENGKLASDLQTMKAQSDTSSAAMDKAFSNEGALVDGLNGFCKG